MHSVKSQLIFPIPHSSLWAKDKNIKNSKASRQGEALPHHEFTFLAILLMHRGISKHLIFLCCRRIPKRSRFQFSKPGSLHCRSLAVASEGYQKLLSIKKLDFSSSEAM